ncbi:MAG: hypothetical protein GXP54_10500 [Deltaproteobacteria bacterium]|nr:hypothetical protein [Deltaproteobacteria bacterium]
MPAVQAQVLAQMAKANFKAKAIRLPLDFKGFTDQAPFGAKDQKTPNAAAMFIPPSTLSYHVDTANVIGKNVEELIDACADAIGKGMSQWQAGAKFTGVLINGPVGMAIPGSLVAPPFMSGPMLFSMVDMAGRQPTFIQYARSITFAIGMAFQVWQSGYMVMMTFPGGAVCSVTMPPSPNIPLPLAAGFSPGDAMMSAASLKGLMLANHGLPGNHAMDIFDAFAQAFATLFMTWKGSTMITAVIGAGGVAPPPPAPPAPVVMATGNMGSLP